MKKEITSSNTYWIFISLFFIVIFNAFFQYCIHQKALNLFWSQVDKENHLGSSINVIFYAVQSFTVLTSIVGILIGALVVAFFGFLFGIKKKKKDYLLVYSLTSLFLSFKLVIAGIVNLFHANTSKIYIVGKQSFLSQIADPFLWLSTVLFFLLGVNILSSNRKKVFYLTLNYLLIKFVNIGLSYFLNYIV
ncbi:hypothetical protein [Heyndrickxia faecalis]|uniref:hypothetical protein n=1 Tax=Heyndrickxia faecalis TaxID=2824910 RepID=UPI003D23094D